MARIEKVSVSRFGTDKVMSQAFLKAEKMVKANVKAYNEGKPLPHPLEQVSLWADVVPDPENPNNPEWVLYPSTRTIEIDRLVCEEGDTLESLAKAGLVMYNTNPKDGDGNVITPGEWLAYRLSKHYADKQRQAYRTDDENYGKPKGRTTDPQTRLLAENLKKLSPEKQAEFLSLLASMSAD